MATSTVRAAHATNETAFARLRNLLPRGVPLTDAAWRGRHRFIQLTLYTLIPLLAIVGLARGYPLWHVAVEIAPILLLAVAGTLARRRGLKAILISSGLLTTDAILVHFTGGLIESHFSFFVALPLIALYQDIVAFFVAIGFVAVQHAAMTMLVPQSVFNHPAALARPILWAGIHAAYVIGLVSVMLVFWRFAEKSQIELANASVTLTRTAADVEHVGAELARSADAQSMSVEMINDGLSDVQQRIERSGVAINDGELVSALNDVVGAAQMIGELTAQHAQNSDRAATATKDLTAQANYLRSLVSSVE
jgi:methyl-accepting chemotaxis protein